MVSRCYAVECKSYFGIRGNAGSDRIAYNDVYLSFPFKVPPSLISTPEDTPDD